MITEEITPDRIQHIARDPQRAHWTQSPYEIVTCASLIFHSPYMVLAHTEFDAPKLVRRTSWTTDAIGVSQREQFAKYNNLRSFANIVRWFHEEFDQNYIPGAFPHKDYTLWMLSPTANVFINLRQYPEGSFYIDSVLADVELYSAAGERITGGIVSSKQADAETLPREQRTQTLDALCRQNRIRQGSIVLQTDAGKYEGKMGEALLNFATLETLQSFEVDGLTEKINLADLSEQGLQAALLRFKALLDEAGIAYRK